MAIIEYEQISPYLRVSKYKLYQQIVSDCFYLKHLFRMYGLSGRGTEEDKEETN